MKLNPDCIREILFVVENETGYQKPTSSLTVAKKVNFPLEETLYHIHQCELYGFFTEVTHYVNGDNDSTIHDLSPKGHDFVQNIRSNNVWSKTKRILKGVGSFAVPLLIEVASSIIESHLTTEQSFNHKPN